MKLQEAESQIVVDYEVYARRPNHADLLILAIETHRALGRTPSLVAADAAFYSAKTRQRRKPSVLNACASPIAQPRVLSADANRRSGGSAMARNGGRGTHHDDRQ